MRKLIIFHWLTLSLSVVDHGLLQGGQVNNVTLPVSWTPKLSDSEKVSNLPGQGLLDKTSGPGTCYWPLSTTFSLHLGHSHAPTMTLFPQPSWFLSCVLLRYIGLASLPTLAFTTLYCNCIFHYFKNIVKHSTHKSIKKNTVRPCPPQTKHYQNSFSSWIPHSICSLFLSHAEFSVYLFVHVFYIVLLMGNCPFIFPSLPLSWNECFCPPTKFICWSFNPQCGCT